MIYGKYMPLRYLIVAAIVIFLAFPVEGKQRNLDGGLGSCSQIVVIESIEVFNYLGNVTFKVPSAHDGVWRLSMKTDTPFAFFGGWGVKIQVDETTHSLVRMTSLQPQTLKPGDKLSFRFRLYWNRDEKTWPKVRNIIWENQVICDASMPYSKKKVSRNSISKYEFNSVNRDDLEFQDPETTNMI